MTLDNSTNHASTQNTEYSQVWSIALEIKRVHDELKSLSSLEPSDDVDLLFTSLVTLCTKRYTKAIEDQVLTHPAISPIRANLLQLCSTGEASLETFWSKKLSEECIADDYDDNESTVKQFVYYDNYEKLSRLELFALKGLDAKLGKILFVGSGPLPLSSIMLAKMSPGEITQVDNVDINQKSNEQAKKLTDMLSIGPKFVYHSVSAEEYDSYGEADVIFLAALVGMSIKEKRNILSKIAANMRPDAFLLVRTAHSLRELLYPALKVDHIESCGFDVEITFSPRNDVVNSFFIAKKKGIDAKEQ